MLLDDYQVQAYSTARHTYKILYPLAGIVGEWGELVDCLMERFPDRHKILGEVGDILWYIGAICTDLDLNLSEVMGVEEFWEIKSAAITHGQTLSRLGKLGEGVKKFIRDYNNDKKAVIKEQIRALVCGLLYHCECFDINITEAAEFNIRKVISRKERGVTKGDGDNR